jgi:putative aminopeptidase FrvX
MREAEVISRRSVRTAVGRVKVASPSVPIPDLLRTLLTTPGPSGFEADAGTAWREAASAFAEVGSDALGSSWARVKGTGDGPSVALVGHIDEIGLAITHVDDKGFLSFRGLGGWLPEVLHAQRVLVLTREGRVPGVIGKKRGPFKKDKDEKIDHEDLHIDIGAKDGDDAKSKVRVGDGAVLVGEPQELPNNRVASRSFDNRIGCFVAAEVARRVAEAGGAPGDVVAVAAVGEEVGDFAGARTTAYALRPDVAIAIDVTDARDVPDADPKGAGEAGLGRGPAVARGAPLSAKVSELLYETAEQEGIPFTVDVMRGSTHTDADAYHLSRAGIPTGLVSVPTRYIHTPVETLSLDDVENAVKLLVAATQRLGSLELTTS